MRRILVAVAAAGLLAGTSVARTTPTDAAAPRRPALVSPTLPEFDARTPLLSATAMPGARVHKAAPDFGAAKVDVRWSALTGGPRSIVPIGGAVTEPSAASPPEVAERFIRENAGLYGLDEADLAGLRLVREYETKDLGVTHLTYVQEADGRRVFGSDLRLAVDGSGRIVWVGGELVPGVSAASKRDAWALDASAAAAAAARSIGASATPQVVSSKGGPSAETVVELGDAFTEPAVVRQLLFPLAPGVVRPAWTALLAERGPGNLYVVTVDAVKGTLLARHNLTRYLGDPRRAQFRVFAQDTPEPDLPHLSSGRPTAVDRVLTGMPSDTFEVSPQGWVGTDSVTSGNNVRAVEDRDGNNGTGAMASGNTDFLFDTVLDFPIKTNLPNTDAAIVNLFYWNNFIHDYLYRLGFDEAAGNFQAVNFTGEGKGGDAVNADAQDGAGTNNANFGTPPDGGAPRMQMFLWNGGFDGDFDQTVIIHEYCHGLSTRLIGGPDYVDGLTGPQSGGMGEGWSDWYALSMLSNAEDDVNATYVVGGYVTRDFNAGVRYFGYSTDMRRNPVTYADIDPATSNTFNDPTEVHSVGEVWCSALWEVRANFIAQYGFAQGKALVERIVTDGMKVTANNPSFVDARDGILVADQIRTGGANQCLIWKGFAKRGVGYSAFTLNGSSTSVKEAFDLPPWCESDGTPALDAASYDDDATTVRLQVGDSDLAGDTSTVAVVTSTSGDREDVTLDQATGVPGLFATTVALRRGAPTAGDGTLDVALGDTITLVYQDASAGGAEVTATARVVRRVALLDDNLESGQANWKAGQFSLTTEAFASPSHSWTDSPGTNYSDESAYRLQIKTKFDFTNTVGSRLIFSQKFDTEPGYDLCIVEARAKGVAAWRTLAVFSGSQPDFQQVAIDLSEFDGKKGVRLRFSLVSDQLVNADGWHIDDVEVQTGRTQ